MPERRPEERVVDVAFGTVLRALREEQGISQEHLGLETGAGRTFVSQLERGVRGSSLKTLFRLADYFNVAPSEVVERVERELRKARRRKGER